MNKIKKEDLEATKIMTRKCDYEMKKRYVTVQCLLKDLLNCKKRLGNFHSTKVKKLKNTILFWLFVDIPKICSIEKKWLVHTLYRLLKPDLETSIEKGKHNCGNL